MNSHPGNYPYGPQMYLNSIRSCTLLFLVPVTTNNYNSENRRPGKLQAGTRPGSGPLPFLPRETAPGYTFT